MGGLGVTLGHQVVDASSRATGNMVLPTQDTTVFMSDFPPYCIQFAGANAGMDNFGTWLDNLNARGAWTATKKAGEKWHEDLGTTCADEGFSKDASMLANAFGPNKGTTYWQK